MVKTSIPAGQGDLGVALAIVPCVIDQHISAVQRCTSGLGLGASWSPPPWLAEKLHCTALVPRDSSADACTVGRTVYPLIDGSCGHRPDRRRWREQ